MPTAANLACGWRATLDAVQLWFVTWEEVLAEIGSDQLDQFYQQCRRCNRRAPAFAADP